MSKKHPRPIAAQQCTTCSRPIRASCSVSAYESEEEFRQHDFEGAISLNEFLKRKDSLPKDENVIFYCACPHDEGATRQAQKYFREGFTNARILQGGVNAWKEAGYGVVHA